MAEDEPARHLRRAHEIEREERVERAEPLRRLELGDRRREIGLERLSRHGCRLEQRALARGERCELLGERCRDGRRHTGYGEPAVAIAEHRRRASVTRGPGELLEVERVAAAMTVDLRDRLRIEIAEERRRLALAELVEHDPLDSRDGECRPEAVRRLSPPEREREQHGSISLPAQQRAEQLDRRAVGPVHVVEHEDERPVAREQLEQRTDRAVRAVPLVRRRFPRASVRPSQRRDDLADLEREVRLPSVLEVELLGGHVGIECVHPGTERQLALELGRRAGEDERTCLLGTGSELGEQPCLADPGVALDRHARLRAGCQRLERRVEPIQLGLAPDRRRAGEFDAHLEASLLRFGISVQGTSPRSALARCGKLTSCRRTSSTTNTPHRSVQPHSPPGPASRARCVIPTPQSTCLVGGHAIWWRVQAESVAAALALLPRFVARRTVPIEVRDIAIP